MKAVNNIQNVKISFKKVIVADFLYRINVLLEL